MHKNTQSLFLPFSDIQDPLWLGTNLHLSSSDPPMPLQGIALWWTKPPENTSLHLLWLCPFILSTDCCMASSFSTLRFHSSVTYSEMIFPNTQNKILPPAAAPTSFPLTLFFHCLHNLINIIVNCRPSPSINCKVYESRVLSVLPITLSSIPRTVLET